MSKTTASLFEELQNQIRSAKDYIARHARHAWFERTLGTDTSALPPLVKGAALKAEKAGDTLKAVALWKQLADRGASAGSPKDVANVLRRIVKLEVQINNDPAQDHTTRLQDLWSFADSKLDNVAHDIFHAEFLRRAATAGPDQDYTALLRILEPLHQRYPEEQEAYGIAFRMVRDKTFEMLPGWQQDLQDWWKFCENALPDIQDPLLEYIKVHVRRLAREALKQNRINDAEIICIPQIKIFPEDIRSLNLVAQIYEANSDWRTASNYWQLSAATSMPITTNNGAIVADNPEEDMRRTKIALKGLRTTKLRLATDLLAAGKMREFTETVCRAVELLPDQRLLKKQREFLDTVKLYVQNAMEADQTSAPHRKKRPSKPLKIAFCVDILKISEKYTHSKILFAMCRNLMALDPKIETHIIITNERLVVSTPRLAPAFNLNTPEVIHDTARKAMPEFYGSRFHVHIYNSFGLEGLIDTCKNITALDPDVIIYGGGHRGLLSNESRVVRHCLYDSIATAFFYFQANNEVDEKFDVIIARGPHGIRGEPGNAKVCIQPYPTITDTTLVSEPTIDRKKAKGKCIVSAVAGVRLDLRLQAQSKADLKALFGILDDNSGAVWHFIGSDDPHALADSLPWLKPRIKDGQIVLHKFLGFEEFTDMASNAALFLQLPGFTGGAGAAGIARRNGVPILTFEDSDVSGRQPAETVFAEDDVIGFSKKAGLLLRDHDEWERIARLQGAHSRYLCETAPQGFYDCLNEAYTTAQARITKKQKERVRSLKNTG